MDIGIATWFFICGASFATTSRVIKFVMYILFYEEQQDNDKKEEQEISQEESEALRKQCSKTDK